MSAHDIIVLGASAGGVEALSQLVKRLPKDLPASLFVAVHFPPQSISVLPQILSRLGTLPAQPATHGEIMHPGQIYVAVPNYHLILQRGFMWLDGGPQENGYRPAVDVLFRSAAHAYRDRVVGVLLSGALDDGTAGLSVIKQLGGIALVQDPKEAAFDGMPCSAIAHVAVDRVLPIHRLADCLEQLVTTSVEANSTMTEERASEAELLAQDKAALERGERPGSPSPLTCPDCGGVLWEIQNHNLIRFRCHVGHAYSMESMIAAQANDLEKALWSALRALEEKAALARRMATHAAQTKRNRSASQFAERASEAEHHANLLRQVIMQQNHLEVQDGDRITYPSLPEN